MLSLCLNEFALLISSPVALFQCNNIVSDKGHVPRPFEIT